MTLFLGCFQIIANASTDESQPQAVVDLIKRIAGEKGAEKFLFVLESTISADETERFSIASNQDKVQIKGNTISAITTGLGWYLNYYANVNIAWNALNEKSEGQPYVELLQLPLPEQEEIHISDAKYRYFFNYCTFGYSMTTWTWKRWQQEIDWMALHGINIPLALVGTDVVWKNVLTEIGYQREDIDKFVAGPGFQAWWLMNNLEG